MFEEEKLRFKFRFGTSFMIYIIEDIIKEVSSPFLRRP